MPGCTKQKIDPQHVHPRQCHVQQLQVLVGISYKNTFC